jgi:Protein of unknown function (DUF3326)
MDCSGGSGGDGVSAKLHTTVLIVPTGIGAAIGGYAGDALPVVRAMAAVSDRVITHPNVLNGAQLYWPIERAYYVEGYGLDRFAAGQWQLQPVHQNRIGLLLDSAIEPDLRWRQLQAADAARATLGLDLTDYVLTDAPLGVTLKTASSGATWGTIDRPDSLLRGAQTLIEQAGATAIAVVARFPDDMDSPELLHYRQGQGVDPLSGAEAVISHLIVRAFGIPCAHAPALLPLPLDPEISPRSAAEEIGYTFLPCVLAGLSRAPHFKRDLTCDQAKREALITAAQVDAVVVPETACGGAAVIALAQRGVRVIAVANNTTQMQVPPDVLGIAAIRVNSYLEAIGVIAAQRSGVHWQALLPGGARIKPLS